MTVMNQMKDIIENYHLDDPLEFKKIIDNITTLIHQAPPVNKLIEFSEEAEENLYGIANHFYEQARYKEALEIFEKLIMLNCLSYRYMLGAGACLHQLQSYLPAIMYYILAASNDTSNPSPSFFAAECSLELDKKQAALFFFEETLKKIGDHTEYKAMKERVELLIPALKNLKS